MELEIELRSQLSAGRVASLLCAREAIVSSAGATASFNDNTGGGQRRYVSMSGADQVQLASRWALSSSSSSSPLLWPPISLAAQVAPGPPLVDSTVTKLVVGGVNASE